jgi:hypothetical protein
MIMKKTTLYLLLVTMITAVSCSKDKKSMLSRKWQASALNSPQMDQVIAEQEHFIDTFGKQTPPVMYDTLFGTSNIDSLRESLKSQLKDYKAMQDHSLKNTWFDFRKDGTVVMNFSGQVDSTKWTLEGKEQKELVLDQSKISPNGEKIKMNIEKLDAKELKLQFSEGGVSSTITFVPAKN